MDLTAELQSRILAMEMRCYFKILLISYKDHVTKQEVYAKIPAGDQTIQRPLDHCKETQNEVVWTYLPFIRSGQNYLARHRESGKKRQTEKEVGREHQGMDRPGVHQVPEGREKWRKLVAKSSVVPQRPSWVRDR